MEGSESSSHTAARSASLLAAFVLLACALSAGAADVPPRFVFLLDEPRIEPASDTLRVLVPGKSGPGDEGGRAEMQADGQHVPGEAAGRRENTRIVGGSFFGSGVFLCGWGIASWQFEEDQCCPPRNTENVIKIIVGVVFINAGLAYLLGVLG